MAQSYPTKPVRIIVGWAAGGTPDTIGRLMAQWLSERLGQQFVMENRPGVTGNLATRQWCVRHRTAIRSFWPP